jgi:hypothetical protein
MQSFFRDPLVNEIEASLTLTTLTHVHRNPA